MSQRRLVVNRVEESEERRMVERSNSFELAYEAGLSGQCWPRDIRPILCPLGFSGWLEGKLQRRIAQEGN